MASFYLIPFFDTQVLHSKSTKHPDGLAIDWIGRNVYWSDNLLNMIEVSRLNGRNRKVLKRGVSEPRALQLYPGKGYLFYTDWGQEAHIGRMGMDGSNYTAIITESIGENLGPFLFQNTWCIRTTHCGIEKYIF